MAPNQSTQLESWEIVTSSPRGF